MTWVLSAARPRNSKCDTPLTDRSYIIEFYLTTELLVCGFKIHPIAFSNPIKIGKPEYRMFDPYFNHLTVFAYAKSIIYIIHLQYQGNTYNKTETLYLAQ